jgi:hypothetical protein
MNKWHPKAKGWQFARVEAVPVEARTWAKNRGERTWAESDFRFSSTRPGRMSRNRPGSGRSPYQPRPNPSPFVPVFASVA